MITIMIIARTPFAAPLLPPLAALVVVGGGDAAVALVVWDGVIGAVEVIGWKVMPPGDVGGEVVTAGGVVTGSVSNGSRFAS
jgi:hypothetical protein